MKPEDLVFNAVYKGSLKIGAIEREAKDCAVRAMSDYKKNKFKKVSDLIKKYIK